MTNNSAPLNKRNILAVSAAWCVISLSLTAVASLFSPLENANRPAVLVVALIFAITAPLVATTAFLHQNKLAFLSPFVWGATAALARLVMVWPNREKLSPQFLAESVVLAGAIYTIIGIVSTAIVAIAYIIVGRIPSHRKPPRRQKEINDKIHDL